MSEMFHKDIKEFSRQWIVLKEAEGELRLKLDTTMRRFHLMNLTNVHDMLDDRKKLAEQLATAMQLRLAAEAALLHHLELLYNDDGPLGGSSDA